MKSPSHDEGDDTMSDAVDPAAQPTPEEWDDAEEAARGESAAASDDKPAPDPDVPIVGSA